MRSCPVLCCAVLWLCMHAPSTASTLACWPGRAVPAALDAVTSHLWSRGLLRLAVDAEGILPSIMVLQVYLLGPDVLAVDG